MNKQSPVLCSSMEEISQLLVGGMEEFVGQEDMENLLNQGGIDYQLDSSRSICLRKGLSFTEIKLFQTWLENAYGDAGCRGAALRTGRSFFQDFFQQYGIETGLNSLEFRMKPLKKRIMGGLEVLSVLFTELVGVNIQVREDDLQWYWVIKNEALCRDHHQDGVAICDFSIGFLQAYLAWASGGKAYPVQKGPETGAACVVEITKKAIG